MLKLGSRPSLNLVENRIVACNTLKITFTNPYKKYLDEITIVDAHLIKTTAILHDQQYSRVLVIELILANGEDSRVVIH